MKKLFLFLAVLVFMASCSTLQTQKTVITSLPVVQNFSAQGGIRSVNLSWSAVKDPRVEGYIIYRAPSSSGPFKELTTIKDRFKTSYLDTGGFLKHLGDNMDYFYKIVVYNKQGIGPSSPVVVGHTAPPPKSPTKITAQSGLPRMVAIKWEPVSDKSVIAYNVYRSLSPKGPFKKIGHVSGHLNNFYVDKNLKDGSTYYYSVTSVNYDGVEGDILAYAKATTKFKPLAPRNIAGQVAGAGKLLISWWPSLNADVVKYRIYRGTDPDSLSLIGEVSSSKLTYLDSGLAPGTTYYYKINAVDKDGIESDSKEIKAVKTKPLPLPPKGIKVSQLSDGSVLITWDKGSPDTVSYEVFRRYYLIITKKIADTSKTQYIDSSVSPNTTYYYWVKSVDKYGQESKSSPVVSIKTH